MRYVLFSVRKRVGCASAVSLEPILAAVRKRLPKARHAEGEAFVNAFYRRMKARPSVVATWPSVWKAAPYSFLTLEPE